VPFTPDKAFQRSPALIHDAPAPGDAADGDQFLHGQERRLVDPVEMIEFVFGDGRRPGVEARMLR